MLAAIALVPITRTPQKGGGSGRLRGRRFFLSCHSQAISLSSTSNCCRTNAAASSANPPEWRQHISRYRGSGKGDRILANRQRAGVRRFTRADFFRSNFGSLQRGKDWIVLFSLGGVCLSAARAFNTSGHIPIPPVGAS